MRDVPVKVGDIVKKNPEELQCLGFNVVDLDVSFKKAQVQLSTYFKEIHNPDAAVCEKFYQELATAPQRYKDEMGGKENWQSTLQKTWDDLQKKAGFDASAFGLETELGLDPPHDEL